MNAKQRFIAIKADNDVNRRLEQLQHIRNCGRLTPGGAKFLASVEDARRRALKCIAAHGMR